MDCPASAMSRMRAVWNACMKAVKMSEMRSFDAFEKSAAMVVRSVLVATLDHLCWD